LSRCFTIAHSICSGVCFVQYDEVDVFGKGTFVWCVLSLIASYKAPLILSLAINQSKPLVSVSFSDVTRLDDGPTTITNVPSILRRLSTLSNDTYTPKDPIKSSQTDYWIDFSTDKLAPSCDFGSLSDALYLLDTHLKLRTFLAGYQVRLADIAVWGGMHYSLTLDKKHSRQTLYLVSNLNSTSCKDSTC